MKTWLLIVGLALVTVLANGCIVIDTEKTETSWSSTEPEDVTIREIDAVGRLSLEDNQREGYKRIAQRHNLSGGAQVHLVEAVFEHLSLEDSKVDVLLTLVHNRCFSPEAKGAILDRLDKLALEDSRREILSAMSRRRH